MQEITPSDDLNFQRQQQDRELASNPNSIYADSMRDEKVRNVIAQLNPELLLTELEHRIRGERKDPETEIWNPIDKTGKHIINEKLVQNYVSFLNVYLTQNVSLSNFTSNEINAIMNVLIDYVRDDLPDNAEDYALTTKQKIEVERTVEILTPVVDEEGITSMRETPIKIKQMIDVGEEITDFHTMTRIGHIVCQSTFSVLKQAQNGMLANRVFKALRVTESLNEGGNKSKMDMFKFW